jgi:hypothetical protein
MDDPTRGDTIRPEAPDAIVEDFLLRGMCSRDEAEAEARRLLRGQAPAIQLQAIPDGVASSRDPAAGREP